ELIANQLDALKQRVVFISGGLRPAGPPYTLARGGPWPRSARVALSLTLVRTALGLVGGPDRPVQVVDHFEQADEHFTAAAFGVLRQFLAHPRAGVLEFARRLAVLREIFFRLLFALRELLLELFYVRRLERRLRR